MSKFTLLCSSVLHGPWSSDCPHTWVLSHFHCVLLLATLWTVAHHAPLSMEFSRQECWSGLPFPPSRNLLDPENEPESFMSPALVFGFFTTSAIWEAHTQTQSLPDLVHYYLWLCGYFSDVSFSHWIPSCNRGETMSAMTHHHVPRANQNTNPITTCLIII